MGNPKIGAVGIRRTEQVVRNSTVVMEGGYAEYLVADSLGDGIVTGERTLTMTGGKADLVVAGSLIIADVKPAGGYYQTPGNPNSPCPYQSKEKVTVNICGDAVVGSKVYGGTVISDSDFMNTLKTGDLGVGGDVFINVYGNAQVKGEIRGGGGTHACVEGKVTINLYEDAIVSGNIYGGARGGLNGVGAYVRGGTEITVDGNAQIKKDIYGGSSYSATSAYCYGDTKVNVKGGTISGNVYGGGDRDIIQGSTSVLISGGVIEKSVYGGGSGSTIEGGTNVTLTGGSVEGAVYGTGVNDTVKGDVTISILGGDWSDTDIVALAEGAKLEGGNAYLYVGSDEQAYDGSVKSFEGFNHLVVHKNSTFDMSDANVFGISNQTITLSAINLQKAAVTGAYAEVGAEGVTLTLQSEGRLRSGKYLVAAVDSLSKNRAASANVPSGWTLDNVTVNGIATFDDLEWIGNTLYLNYLSSGVEAAALSNWGVFKSSQAFVNALWNQRGENAVSLDANDGKGGILPATRNMAWAAVYGMDGHICDTADYNTYGVAVGAERKFGKSSSVGLALGYGWGEVSPFAAGKVDQESAYLAMYGCVGTWNMYKGNLSVDWSVAVGDTTSESKEYSGDWSQTSWQLDARATYSRAISERTTASAFVGVQYYTHDSAEVDGVSISGMDNLRLFVGGGLNRRVSERASVYGEASVFADVLRDNPYAVEAGQRYEGNNPGRVGGKVGVGASYSISDKWSARGGYSFEVADDNTEHNLNLGASYSF